MGALAVACSLHSGAAHAETPNKAPAERAAVTASGAAHRAEAEGWEIKTPQNWKFAVQGPRVLFGSDTEAGLIVVWFTPGATFEQVQQTAAQPYVENGLTLTPTGAPKPFGTKGGKAVVVDTQGMAADGSTIVSHGIGIAGPNGAVAIVGLTLPDKLKALSARVDEMGRSVSFFTPKVAAGASLLSGAMCSWSGSSSTGSSMSNTQRMVFDGKGNVGHGSETTFSGTTGSVGDANRTDYSGAAGNQFANSSVGRYTVSGNQVQIQWQGNVQDCTVHNRGNGGRITELMCGKKLWGGALCE